VKALKLKCLGCIIYIYKDSEKEQYTNDFGEADSPEVNGNGVWMKDDGDLINTAYHEAVHVADWVIAEWLGIDIAEENTELRARLTEHVGSEIIKYCS